MSKLDAARAARAIRTDLPAALVSGFIDEKLRTQAGGRGEIKDLLQTDSIERKEEEKA